MIDIHKSSECCGCSLCVSVCPKKCIKMQTDAEGFCYPVVNKRSCDNCGSCDRCCPMKKAYQGYEQPIVYAAFNKNEEIRKNSSSGAFFWELAKYIIDRNGVVFGARLDDQFRVVHDFAETMEQVQAFCGSKYTQSDVRESYQRVKTILNDDRWVLFTGTACQIVALKQFLKKDFNRLICQDIACHGVTSNLLWDKYRLYQEKRYKSSVKAVSFRDKISGWKGYSVCLNFNDGSQYINNADGDLYMRAYRSNLYLRPSCYECRFRGVTRKSDFTLADFWGVDRLMPEMDDNKGTSLVFIHSKLGREIFENLKDRFTYKEIDVGFAVSDNPAITSCVMLPERRFDFISAIQKECFDRVVEKYCKKTITIYDVKVKIAKLVRRIYGLKTK